MNMLTFAKNQVFLSFVAEGPSETGKPHLLYNWLKTGTLQPKIDKTDFFCQPFQPIYVVKRIKNLKFDQHVNFEFKKLFKMNGTKFL